MASRKVNGTATILEKEKDKEKGEQPGLELLLEATARLRGAPTAGEVLQVALEAVEDTSSWKAGAAWVADGGRLRSAAGELREGEGVPGRAWRQRDVYQVADLAPWRDDPRVQAALRGGQEAWIGLPILRSGEVDAVLDFFAPEGPDGPTERVLRAFGRMVAERLQELRQKEEGARQEATFVDYRNQLQAISEVQAVIEFNLDGTVITANDNFLKTTGYKLEELRGQHHRMFCEAAYAGSRDYELFWEKLRRGEYVAGRFPRVAKDGRVVWLRASYNTILDGRGKPAKVVKWATDITSSVEAEDKAEVVRQEAARIRNMMENAPIAVMGCDLDLTITYMNACSTTTLKKLQQYLPCRVEEMVGKSIDIFHKHPEHQRRLLADPKNLPHQANINVGPETLALMVSATLDAEGRYVGPMLTWELITEKQAMLRREQERQEQERRETEELNAKVGSILTTVTANAQGDLTQDVEILSDDPVGRVGQGIARLVSDMRHSLSEIRETALTLGSASEELTAVGRQMNAHSEGSAQQATAAAAAGEEVNHNIQTVAAATEEMTASIREIAKNAHQAARVSSNAVEVANTTNQTIAKLGESSSEIGKVIKVISSIAQQTNLLALNATIEAARAGEAGRGFAVVANEVKELAKETAKATEDITQKIETIQSDSTGAVQAIAEITGIIHEISDIANTIAGAVEEQSATTSEISRNVSEAARGSAEISRAIGQVAQAADSSREGAEESLQACNSLATLAAQLQALISRFKL